MQLDLAEIIFAGANLKALLRLLG